MTTVEFWQIAIGVSSSIVAVCALVLSIWQGLQMRRHNKISFRPHLTTWYHQGKSSGHYQLDLINNGLGPAVISSYKILLDNQFVSGNGLEPMEKALKILFESYKYKPVLGYVAPGYSVAPKERCTLVGIQFEEKWPSEEIMEHLVKRLDIQVKYKSFYGEVFSMGLHD